jgi:hypothetical protein
MRPRALRTAIPAPTIASVLFLLIQIAWPSDSSAIPNCCEGAPAILPANSDIPHEHTTDTVKRGAVAGALTDVSPAGDHNHRDAHKWQGVKGAFNDNHRWNFDEPGYVGRVWDN